MRPLLSIAAPLVLASAAAARGPDPGFWLTGWAPGAERSQIFGVSSDGVTAVGGSYGKFPFHPGFSWTREGGRYDFGLLQGMPKSSQAFDISDNGLIVGDMYESDPANRRAYRWTGSGSPEDLGLLPNQSRSYAAGISGDGQIVVGTCEKSQLSDAYGEAFIWRPQTGIQGLGYLQPDGAFSKAYGISRDGSTVVGTSTNGPFGIREAFTWTEAGGMKKLPELPDAPFLQSEAFAVSADGSVAVGHSPAPGDGFARAVRWSGDEPTDLGTILGHKSSSALAVNGNGGVIGGTASTGLTNDAFVWTESTGMVALADYLAAYGIQVSASHRLIEVYGISTDGLTFAGRAFDLQKIVSEGFVATVPSPATVTVLLAPCFFRRRRT